MRIKIFIILFTLLFLITIENSELKSDQKQTIQWESFNSGIAKAKVQKKPVIIDFYADWCHWCKVMEKETFSNKEVIQIITKKFIAVRIDTQKGEKITFMGTTATPEKFAQMLGVKGLPTTVFMDKNGSLIDLMPGYIKADIFVKILGYIGDECFKKQIPFEDYLNKKVDCK